jgi:hypothetical protein
MARGFRTATVAAFVYAGVFIVTLIIDMIVNSNGENSVAPIFFVFTLPAFYIDQLARWLVQQWVGDYVIGGTADFFIMLVGGALFWASVASGWGAIMHRKNSSHAVEPKI